MNQRMLMDDRNIKKIGGGYMEDKGLLGRRWYGEFQLNKEFVKKHESRIDTFAEILASLLIERLDDQTRPIKVCHLVVNVAGKSDPLVRNAAEEAYMDLTEMQSLLPNNLIIELRHGSVRAVNAETGHMKAIYPAINIGASISQENVKKFRPRNVLSNLLSPSGVGRYAHETKRRPQLRVQYENENFDIEKAIGRPHFELQRDEAVYTAQAFAATRFGSTKLKSHQGVDTGNGFHAFTTPSLYAYLQLLIFLNALACLTVWSEKLEQEISNFGEVRSFPPSC